MPQLQFVVDSSCYGDSSALAQPKTHRMNDVFVPDIKSHVPHSISFDACLAAIMKYIDQENETLENLNII